MRTSAYHPYFRISIILMLIFGLLLPPLPNQAATDPTKYPRTGNYFLRGGPDITPDMVPLLARYDLLVLPAENQIANHDLFGTLRKLNPDIVILAYVASTSYATIWNDALHGQLLAGIKDEWWLRDAAGNARSIWPGTRGLNLASGWASYLAEFTRTHIWNTGLWDGIFFDEIGDCIVCDGLRAAPFAVDLDRDGRPDAGAAADAAWRNGTANLLRTFRELAGTRPIVITNGSSLPAYQPHVNGRMFESFPTPWEAGGNWSGVMQNYAAAIQTVGGRPAVFFIDGDTGNTGINNDYRDVRFGLTSTLLKDGYFGYSWGLASHGQLWWYDEYETALGAPQGTAIPLDKNYAEKFMPGLWRRAFERGLVLVNSTKEPQTVSLGEDFEKIHGAQDPRTNDGSVTSRVRIPGEDGLILLRLTEEVRGVAFPNGAFTRILDRDGRVKRTGFFLYDARASGESTVLRADLDQDGSAETIVADAGRISIWKNGSDAPQSFAPYGEGYHGTMNLAVGDTDGNGFPEIITAPGRGGGPHVRIFSGDGRLLSPGFFAFPEKFYGGLTVAVADIDGDGRGEIVVGSGPGGAPTVRIFKSNGMLAHDGFTAYDPGFRGGVRVAGGDIDGDGIDEIIVGAGRGGGPHVRIFDGAGASLGRGFFPYDKDRRAGVFVGATDIDHDGSDEILALTIDIL